MSPIPRRSPTADLARGAGSLVAAAALLVGVPWFLVAAIGWPLPHGIPSLDEIGRALSDGYLPDGTLIKALAVVVWIIWAQLAVAFVVESIAVARGRHAGTVPAAGGIHRLAGRLVAGITLLGVLSATKGVPIPLPVDRPLSPGLKTPPAVATVLDDVVKEKPPPAPAPLPVYEVQRRDTLWDIADRHLGDPFRWPEIYELNGGRIQPDGGALSDADLILPGWQLHLPADAQGLAVAPAPEAAPTPEDAPPVTPDTVPVIAVTDDASGDVLVRLPDAPGTHVGGADERVVVDAEPIGGELEVMVRLPDAAPSDRTDAEPGPANRKAPHHP